jgi:TrpR family trp operon transcriptional repressor
MDNNSDLMNERSKIALEELINCIASVSDKDLLTDFFDCLFTPSELYDIGKRWLLVKEIDKGTTQREIAKEFKMSLCKITRGSKELKKEDSAFRKMLDMVKK